MKKSKKPITKKRKSQLNKLPKHVLLKFNPKTGEDNWQVRRSFPTDRRRANGAIVYVQLARWCVPETAFRAAQLSQELEDEYNDITGAAPTPEQIDELTVAAWCDEFLAIKKIGIGKGTYENYETALRNVTGADPKSVPPFGRLLLRSVKLIDVQNFYTYLAEKKKKSAARILEIHRKLCAAFNRAVLLGRIDKSPIPKRNEGLELPLHTPDEITYFNARQAAQFIKACRQDDEHIVLEFGIETGMRPEEYLALRWSDINLQKCTVQILRAVVHPKGGGFFFKDTKTKGSKRTIEISKHLRDRLLVHQELYRADAARERAITKAPLILEHMARTGVNYERRKVRRKTARQFLENLAAYDLLFPSETGTPMSEKNLNRRGFREVIKRSKLKGDFSLYSLRHTMATLALEQGVYVKAVSEKLGHTTTRMTMEKYGHVVPSLRKEVTDKLSAALYETV